MHLVIDFETRSRIDLIEAGHYRYAEDPSTEILCLAVKEDDRPPFIWIPEKFKALHPEPWEICTDQILADKIEYATTIEAHNAGFERAIWHHIMHKRYGFADLPIKKMRCSAVKAAAFALPRALDRAGKALSLSTQKDMAGHKIMQKLCKPNIRTGKWNEDPKDFEILVRYCLQDVEVEHALSKALYNISAKEQELWELDQTINDRGIKLDIPGCKNLIAKVKSKEEKLLIEVQQITGGEVTSVRQIARTISWLKTKGVELDDLTKQTVTDKLPTMDALPKRLLEIRQELGKSSVSKLETMIAVAGPDERARGTLLFCGANTRRWSGRLIQPQNMPRDSYTAKEVDAVLDCDLEMTELLYGNMHPVASKCLRGMIIAEPGNELVVADFSSIEARVLAWLALEVKTLEAFRSGKCVYSATASHIYKKPYESIDKKSKERQIGKVAVLALGYQGWIGAFHSMAKGYGVTISDEEATEIIKNWRKANANIVRYWASIEKAALQAVKTGKVFSVGRVKFGTRSRFLQCRLPSGGLLAYCDPSTAMVKTKYGVEKEVISFMGVDSKTGAWCKQFTYGGSLVENIVQATARDLLAEAMLRAEARGHKVVMHVHDEIVVEAKKGSTKLKDFETLISVAPEWADGCPIGAEGFIDYRYRK